MARTIIGVMGPGAKATPADLKNAHEIGLLCAQKSYTLLTGGRPSGVMEAALKGAKSADGQTIGILPSADKADASSYADVVIVTGMMSARNNINVLSSDIVIACGIEAGTLSEIALALKAGKYVVLLSENDMGNTFLKSIGKEQLFLAKTPTDAMQIATRLLS